jgi:arylsulfatase A-like enzyme/Flp pilus assembly protein TadD
MAKRHRLISLLLIALTAGAVTWYIRSSSSRRRPRHNVVLISIDTCRADHLSCYSHFRRTTPNIDAVARDGVLFQRAQTTNPLTLPAHCSMLTGTTPIYHGVHLNQTYSLDAANVTLAEILQEAGYQTGAFVGAFPLHSRFGLDQGFDTYDQQFSKISSGQFLDERVAQEVSQAAISWFDQQRDKPFFLFAHFFDPHQPYEPPTEFESAVGNDKYDGEIAYTDFCIGQIIERLKELDLIDSTLIIITADHGEGLGEHLEHTHGFFIYQSTNRVPLIVKSPGCVAGQQVDDAVGLIDIVPTVLGSLGLSVPSQVQGVDLSGYLSGRSEPAEDRFLYSESWNTTSFNCCPLRGLVHGHWRYIWSLRPELYDLNRDPAEATNLVEREPQIAMQLQAHLEEMLADQHEWAQQRNSSVADQETLQRLKSLGYVDGPAVDATSEIGIDQYLEDPKDFIAIYNKILSARNYLRQEQFDEAKAVCLDIAALRPELAPVSLLLGPIAAHQGRMADAVTHYSHVLALRATAKNARTFSWDDVHNRRGIAYAELGQFDLALEDYNQAIEFNPELADAYSNRGWTYLQLENYDLAGRDFDRAIELEPDFATAYNNRARVYRALGNFERALADYSQAIKLKGDEAELFFSRGEFYLQRREYELALSDFNQAVSLKPEYAAAYNNLAWLVATCPDDRYRDARQAVSHARKACELSGWDDFGMLDTLALAYAERGDFSEAVQWQTKALEFAPAEAQADLRSRLELYQNGKPYRETTGQ